MYATIELKKLLSGVAILLAVLIPGTLYLAARQNRAEAIETGSWGLSFQTPGQPPKADATADQLRPYDAKYIGDTSRKTIYLTFDCGYENGNTGTILDVLKQHNAPAAFFVVGNYITSAPELVKRMAEEGHIVGNHTWSHPDMSAISDKAAFSRQLQQVKDAYRDCTGAEMPNYYRPPQGVYSEENLKMAKDLGYRTVCGLEAGSAAHGGICHGEAHRADPQRGSGAAPQYLLHQCGNSGQDPHQMGGNGLFLRHAG